MEVAKAAEFANSKLELLQKKYEEVEAKAINDAKDHAAVLKKMREDNDAALQLDIDSTVESFKGSRDFFLINNRAYLCGY